MTDLVEARYSHVSNWLIFPTRDANRSLHEKRPAISHQIATANPDTRNEIEHIAQARQTWI